MHFPMIERRCGALPACLNLVLIRGLLDRRTRLKPMDGAFPALWQDSRERRRGRESVPTHARKTIGPRGDA